MYDIFSTDMVECPKCCKGIRRNEIVCPYCGCYIKQLKSYFDTGWRYCSGDGVPQSYEKAAV